MRLVRQAQKCLSLANVCLCGRVVTDREPLWDPSNKISNSRANRDAVVSWADADAECQSLGYDGLASVRDQAEQDFLWLTLFADAGQQSVADAWKALKRSF